MLSNKTFTATILNAMTVVIALVSATAVQSQEIRTLEDYLNYCVPENEEGDLSEECDRLKEAQESTEESQTESQSSEKSAGIGGYAGIVLGIYFPDIDEDRDVFTGNDVDIDTGFGSSLFAGIRFNRYLATDIELGVLAGNIDSDLDEDEAYTIAGLFLNPRFTLPFTSKSNSLALFLSPGIGVSQLSSSVEDEIEDFDRTTIIEDDSRFTWQVKAGVSIPVSSKLSILPQLRYTSQTGDNAIDYFGTEVGVKFDF